jgi:hypothetical protein
MNGTGKRTAAFFCAAILAVFVLAGCRGNSSASWFFAKEAALPEKNDFAATLV